ncbi:MAG: phasin family protein [Magnetospirillum sp.]|nr:phasin family protein [Magnetospirillum sp.]
MSERRTELKAVGGGENMAVAKMLNGDMMQMTARMMDGWTQVNSRLISLAQSQWQVTQHAAEQLRQCQSPNEMMDLQMRLAREAMDGYVDEARKMSDLVVRMSTDAIGCLTPPK